MAVLFRVYKLPDQVCDNNTEQKQNTRRGYKSHGDLPTNCRPFEMVGGREEKAQKNGFDPSTRIIVSTAAGAQGRNGYSVFACARVCLCFVEYQSAVIVLDRGFLIGSVPQEGLLLIFTLLT